MASALWMLMASACFTLMALIIKQQSDHFGVGDLLFLRLACSAGWVLLLQRALRFPLRTTAIGLHARRAAFGCMAMGAWYHTLGVLPLGVSVTLNYMSPLFLGLLLHLDKDHRNTPTAMQTAMLCVGFIGVLIMMSPFGASMDMSQTRAFAIGVLGALFGAMAFRDVKRLKAVGQNEWQMVFYFCLLGALLSLPFTSVLRTTTATTTAGINDFALLAVAGWLGAWGQLGVSKAFGRGDPVVPASLQYTSVVLSLALGWLLFQEQLGVQRVAGMAVVVAAAIGAIALAARRRPG